MLIWIERIQTPMRPFILKFILQFICLCPASLLAADNPPSRASENQISIYDDVPPGSETGTQKEIEYAEGGKKMIRNVTIPTLTAFLPTAEAATGTAIIVCPGGGFRFLSWQS